MRTVSRAVGVLIAALSLIIAGVVSLVGVGAASADPVTAPICATAGTSLHGHYRDLTVRGNAYVAGGATLTVRGSLTLAPGACLDAFSLGTVRVGGNVTVLRGATLALGCAPGVNGGPPPADPTPPPCGTNPPTHDTVGGSINALAPQTMYLTAVHVARNVTSIGGGPGTKASTTGVSFPVKEMTIGGNLTLLGWHGGWIGALRNTVHGNVVIAGNTGNRPGAGGPDSTEVVGNTIRHNLICVANIPAAQYGDAFYVPGNGVNVVHGHALGECRSLTRPPSS